MDIQREMETNEVSGREIRYRKQSMFAEKPGDELEIVLQEQEFH